MNEASFMRGQVEMIELLDIVEQKKGADEAKAAARSSIAEYIRTAERNSYNYGSFVAAVDWLAAAEGLIQTKEVQYG